MSKNLLLLLNQVEQTKQKEADERQTVRDVRQFKNDLRLLRHFKHCQRCQLELQLCIERYCGSRCPWYLNLINDVGQVYPECPQVENYVFGNYWDRTEGKCETMQFIKDRLEWAEQEILQEYIMAVRYLRELRQNRRFTGSLQFLSLFLGGENNAG